MILHVSLSIRGTLSQSTEDLLNLAPCIIVDGKKLETAEEVQDMLLDQLLLGHEYLPMIDCDNFDFKKGCLGHKSNPGGEVGK